MSFFGLFGNHSNPYRKASKYLKNIPGEIDKYYGPYRELGQQGLDMDPQLNEQYSQMAFNPATYLQSIGQSFNQDPGYQWNLDQQEQAQNQAMAAGGMLGSPEHVQLASQLAANLANQHYDNWLNHALGIAQGGMGSLQNQANKYLNYGYDASNQSAHDMQNYWMNRANTKAAQVQDDRNRQQGLLGALGMGVAGLGGNLWQNRGQGQGFGTMLGNAFFGA